MRTLNIPLEDQEYDRLLEAKGDKSWHDFVMVLVKDNEWAKLHPRQILDNVDKQLKDLF